MIKNGSKFSNGYSMTTEVDGAKLRYIADIMTELGFKMNHSTVKNHILNVVYKFAKEYSKANHLELSEEKLRKLASNPTFQSGFCDMLHKLDDSGNWPDLNMEE